MEESKMQKQFEDIIFAERFLKSIKRNPNVPRPAIAGCLDFVSIDCPKKSEMFAPHVTEQGRYADMYIDAMWFAWKKCCEVNNL